MKPLYDDTTAEAEAVQIELLRRAGPARRFALVCALSNTTIALAQRALRRADPAASAAEIKVRFVALHYGEELARRLREHLERTGT